MKKVFYLMMLIAGLTACEKQEGTGGTSTIKGTITVWEYNKDLTIKLGEYPGQDIDVYIIYGSDDIYGDRFKTGYDGKYEFNYLQEGSYTVYALSADTNNHITNEMIPVFRNVQITGKDQTVNVPEIIIVE